MKIKDLLTDESKWTKGADARSEHSNFVMPESAFATCWCLRGLVYKCYEGEEAYSVICKINNKLDTAICVWNDAPERTFAEVKALVEELDI